MVVENDIEISGGEAEKSNVTTTAVVTTETPTEPTLPETHTATITTTPTSATISVATDTTDSNATLAAPEIEKTTIAITEAAFNPNMTPTLQMSNGENNGNAAAQQQQQQQQQNATTQSESIKGKMDSDASLINFKVLYVVAQLCGLTMIVLICNWVSAHLGGVGVSNPKLEFNWHPICMTIGFIFLYGNSIMIYRGFRTINKKALKITHASIHMVAFVLTVLGLKTAFDSHNLATPPIPNMYSLHSWLGLSAVIIFCLQYVAGFMAYMVPGLKENYKIAMMPLHIYFGLFGFVLAIASALMGLTEKAIWAIPNYSQLPAAGVTANMCGVLFIIFGGVVVYLVTEPSYKRQPRPEDTALLTRSPN